MVHLFRSLLVVAVLGPAWLVAAASPLTDLDVDDLVVARAVNTSSLGKYVGSKCSTSAECYSKNCVSGVCQRQPVGGPCFKNANCETRNCDSAKGTCRTPSSLFGTCGTDDIICSRKLYKGQLQCDGSKCKLKGGAACSSNNACLSGTCGSDKKCTSTSLPPGQICGRDSDCQSGKCRFCRSVDGFVNCEELYYFTYICDRVALGATCRNTNDCGEGVCRDGKCSESRVGDACLNENNCTGDQVCSTSDKKCLLPAPGSLQANDFCIKDDQCANGRCTNEVVYRDENGINRGRFEQSETRCDYLRNGESGCRSTSDCEVGVCKSGTCEAAQVGEQCDVNYRCADPAVCGSDGTCYLPAPNSVGNGASCKSGRDCLSGACNNATKAITRLTLSEPRSSFEAYDTSCWASESGEACAATSDCLPGLTCDATSKTCTGKAVGDACSVNEECGSQACAQGVCGLKPSYRRCSTGAECYSGKCGRPGDCLRWDFDCNSPVCEPIPDGGVCRIGEDCVFPLSLSCEDGICFLPG